jgi:hypothetical protein
MHSWRVLILPYIEQKALYAQYDFNEPWDGPHNRLLSSKMPLVYHCDKDGPAGRMTTSYVAVSGPKTLLSDDAPTSYGAVRDGTSCTLAVVEIANSGINSPTLRRSQQRPAARFYQPTIDSVSTPHLRARPVDPPAFVMSRFINAGVAAPDPGPLPTPGRASCLGRCGEWHLVLCKAVWHIALGFAPRLS